MNIVEGAAAAVGLVHSVHRAKILLQNQGCPYYRIPDSNLLLKRGYEAQSPHAGMVWKLRERGTSSGVILAT
ncbi:hypothetical protein TNCV_1131531 [Trichonephila clavipes]|nr:hypothetical protein TNCV_1131531 [Trichonephila clavipes]